MQFAKRLLFFTIGLCTSVSAFASWSVDEPETEVAEAHVATTRVLAVTEVPELKLKGLAEYRGMYVTVFHVSGRQAQVVGGNGNVLNVSEIKARPLTALIDPSGAAVLPKISVERRGFRVFNFVVISIHKQETLYLRSADESVVKDPRIEDGDMSAVPQSALPYVRAGYLSVPDKLDQLRTSQGSTESVEIQLGRDF